MKQLKNKLAQQWLNLAARRLGSQVLFATDDFFAEKENLLKPEAPIFLPDKYTERGKWMDGWESRRKRTEGHDVAVIQLGIAGHIHGFNIDTRHFLGNHPPHASIEGTFAPQAKRIEDLQNVEWHPLLAKASLEPGSENLFACAVSDPVTHVRLNIFPDGGVARLRVYGQGYCPELPIETFNLAGAEFGAIVTQANDMFFSPKDNLIMPYASNGMHDGWETRRRREPGNDWCIIQLAGRGTLQKVEVDTAFFKGNYPDRFRLGGADLAAPDGTLMPVDEATWTPILDEQKLTADSRHDYQAEVQAHSPITHVRLDIIPDGGVARLRCYGEVS